MFCSYDDSDDEMSSESDVCESKTRKVLKKRRELFRNSSENSGHNIGIESNNEIIMNQPGPSRTFGTQQLNENCMSNVESTSSINLSPSYDKATEMSKIIRI